MNNKHKYIIPILLIPFMVFLMVTSASAITKGGTLKLAQVGEPTSLDPPWFNKAPVDLELIWMIYENLVSFKGSSLELEPRLAERWELSSDALTWTLYLQKGVKFHDGTPFNADAVVYNFDRYLGEEKAKSGAAMFRKLVKSIAAVDEGTVKIHLLRPHAFFLNLLAHPASAIVSPSAHKKYGRDLALHPIGSGPFKVSEWVKGDHLTLEANEHYWKGRPNLDKIILKPVKEDTTRALQLETGQLDVAPLLLHELSGV